MCMAPVVQALLPAADADGAGHIKQTAVHFLKPVAPRALPLRLENEVILPQKIEGFIGIFLKQCSINSDRTT